MGTGRSPVSGGGGGAQVQANPVTNATALTDAEADQIRQQEDSTYDATTTAAVKMYISNTDFDQQGHSLSQTMNYLLDQGVDFSSDSLDSINQKYGLNLSKNDWASMQYTDSRLSQATHAIGKDTLLTRGAHDDLLRDTFGISDYSKMTESQLQSALVGKAFRTKSYMSTSYDVGKNPFLASNSGVSGGREVVFNAKVGSKTKMIFGAKKQSEIILDKSQDFKITGVRYSGKTATPRGKASKPQIIIDIETF